LSATTRLRWEPGEDGILFGYSGTLKPWVFAICPPGSPGEFWMISTAFPLGQPRYVGSEKEARAAAERWLEEFTASLGAVFPDAALKLADDWDAEANRITGIFAADEDPWSRTVGGMRAEAFEKCAKDLRAAITAALTEGE
jgi:hypothetical protein